MATKSPLTSPPADKAEGRESHRLPPPNQRPRTLNSLVIEWVLSWPNHLALYASHCDSGQCRLVGLDVSYVAITEEENNDKVVGLLTKTDIVKIMTKRCVPD